MVALEQELASKMMHIEKLEQARETDREIRDDMLGEIRNLEEMIEKYELEINDLEKDLMRSGLLQSDQCAGVRDKISDLKKSQSTRMSMLRGSMGYS